MVYPLFTTRRMGIVIMGKSKATKKTKNYSTWNISMVKNEQIKQEL